MLSNHLILCYPILFLPSIFPSIRIFSNESALQVAKVQLQQQSFQCIIRVYFLRIDWFLISLQSKGLSRVFSSTIIQKHQSFGTQPFLWSNSDIIHDSGKTIALTTWTIWCNWAKKKYFFFALSCIKGTKVMLDFPLCTIDLFILWSSATISSSLHLSLIWTLTFPTLEGALGLATALAQTSKRNTSLASTFPFVYSHLYRGLVQTLHYAAVFTLKPNFAKWVKAQSSKTLDQMFLLR